MKLHPLTVKKIQRFKQIKRGYWSAIVLSFLILAACGAELFANSRALIVSYNNQLFFPTYAAFMPGSAFDLDYKYETNYRKLSQKFERENKGDWVLLPLIPYNPFEIHAIEGEYPPHPPSVSWQHYLGTDAAGRDIAARIIYGFRISIGFSLILLTFNYLIGTTIGCLMGYWGGVFDIVFQRIIEVWSSVPTLYVIMIIASIMIPDFWVLIGIMVFFEWIGITWYMRTASYREKSRTYVLAAKAIGASDRRIIFNHLLPNSVSVLITFIPFSVTGGITALTALDYLGFGLPPPTPSWGELIRQGITNMDHQWIISSVVVAMVSVLVMVTWIGEAVRESFDPKKHTYYE